MTTTTLRPPAAVIASTGRSASGYIAALLNAVDIPAGHEQWFNPFDIRTPDLKVDSSWCAIPHLDTYDGIIWHQTRHPLDVISSYAARWDQTGPYWDLKRQTFRKATGNLIIDAAAVYIDANQRIEAANPLRRWKVEAVTPTLLTELGRRLGIKVTSYKAAHAIATTPTTTNQHRDRYTTRRLDWDDLAHELPTPLWDELIETTARYGYQTP